MISSIPKIIENVLIVLNIVIFTAIFLYMFIFWYYGGDKKKIKKFWKNIDVGDRTIGDKVASFTFALIFSLWCAFLLISFGNSKINTYIIDYKNCENAVSQNIIDLEQISYINNKLFFYQTLSRYVVFFIDDESKEELLSFEYLQIRSD